MTRFIAFTAVSIVALGCSRQSANQPPIASESLKSVSFNAAGAPTVEFSVPDMMCPESCAVQVKEILAEQPGAKDVVVEFDSKTAKVAIDKDKFDSNKAIAALVDHQFKHAALKGGSAAEALTTSATRAEK